MTVCVCGVLVSSDTIFFSFNVSASVVVGVVCGLVCSSVNCCLLSLSLPQSLSCPGVRGSVKMRAATVVAAAVASLVATSASATVANETWTPVVLMHGINGSPHDFDTMVANLQKAHPGQQIFPLDVFSHALSFLPIWHQIPHITDEVRKLTAGLDSYHLVCHSQGGIVCRALVETMTDHNVDNFVSLAGVQQGVRALPDSWAKFLPGWAQNLTDDEAYEILYSSLGQSISFGNYWRDPAPDARQKYLEFDALLPVLDNDPEVVAVPPTYALTPEERKSNFLKVKGTYFFVLAAFGACASAYPADLLVAVCMRESKGPERSI